MYCSRKAWCFSTEGNSALVRNVRHKSAASSSAVHATDSLVFSGAGSLVLAVFFGAGSPVLAVLSGAGSLASVLLLTAGSAV
jgi:hypothetical protein